MDKASDNVCHTVGTDLALNVAVNNWISSLKVKDMWILFWVSERVQTNVTNVREAFKLMLNTEIFA